MAMYVCGNCIEEYQIPYVPYQSCVARCEVCGPVKNDWEIKTVTLTWHLVRAVCRPNPKAFVEAQLANLSRERGLT